MLTELRHITYRGAIRSCNYTCSYCPFAKRAGSPGEYEQDRIDLERFVQKIEHTHFETPVSILFAPYGEAMLHPWYWEAFVRLCHCEDVAEISCQTNLSFDGDAFLSHLEAAGADPQKIALWATFHPTMVSVEAFARKAAALSHGLRICVGAVGDPGVLSCLQTLRAALPSEISLWINAMDGLGRRYTQAEQTAFLALDPGFVLETERHRVDCGYCFGGRSSIFVEHDGSAFPCNRSRVKLGSLYQQLDTKEHCRGKCDCFLAYSSRRDLPLLMRLGQHPQLRIPVFAPRAAFFDVDGALAWKGRLRAGTEEALAQVAKKMPVYLATARPFGDAMRICKKIRPFLAGGVFAHGAEVREFSQNVRQFYFFDREPMGAVKVYRRGKKAYKAVYHEMPVQLFGNMVQEGRTVSVVPSGASKCAGMEALCQMLDLSMQEVFFLGDSDADAPALRSVGFSAAPPDASEKARYAAHWLFDVQAAAAALCAF